MQEKLYIIIKMASWQATNMIDEGGFTRKQNAVPEGNYKYLDNVKEELDDMELAAKANGNLREAKRIGDSRKWFLNFLDEVNPIYKEARAAAQPKMIREKIGKKLNEEITEGKVTGKMFYDKVLSKYDNYSDIVRGLKNNPKARQAIRDMRIIYKNMSKLPKVATTAEQQAKGYTSPRDFASTFMARMKDMVGAKVDVSKIKYLNSNEWMKDYERMQGITDNSKRHKELLNLIGRIGTAWSRNSEITL